jgi:hypothetical protein
MIRTMLNSPGIFNWAVLPLLLLIGCMIGTRLFVRRLRRRPKPVVTVDRCKCGYVIEKLSAARCPECGRVFGFDATAEELGLTVEQLERAHAIRMRRRQKGG